MSESDRPKKSRDSHCEKIKFRPRVPDMNFFISEKMPRISQMFTDEYGNPTSIPMKIAQCWEVEDQEVPGGRRSIPS